MLPSILAYLGLAAAVFGAALGLFGGYATAPTLGTGAVTAGDPIVQGTGEPVSLLFLGDIMLDRQVADRMRANRKVPLYPFDGVRGADGSFFDGFDAVVANLEGPVTAQRRPPVKSIDFAFATSTPQLLLEAGIDAVSQANNHSLDQGFDGALGSRRLLAESGLAVFGDQVLDDAAAARADLMLRDRRVALLGFNVTDNPLDRDAAAAALSAARAEADQVIVFMHWGEEYQARPSASQVDLAHWFIDRGVDAVIGAHPHWVQSVSSYRGRPIAYSLGNFVFDQDFSQETKSGLMLGLELDETGATLDLYPIAIEASRPRRLEDAERQVRLEALAKISDPALAEQIRQGKVALTRAP